ncbi:hypothetical protein T08_6673 [Trichinella sp. T8]|nr:hypothetical protein T08_6673 [Trichinella sp. T8]
MKSKHLKLKYCQFIIDYMHCLQAQKHGIELIYFAPLPNVTNCCSAESIIFEDRRALRLLSGREACAAAASLDKLSSLSKLNQ